MVQPYAIGGQWINNLTQIWRDFRLPKFCVEHIPQVKFPKVNVIRGTKHQKALTLLKCLRKDF